MQKHMLAGLLITSFLGVNQAHAVDIEAGEKTYKRTCRACHGNDAQGTGSFPRLSDKTADYLAGQLVRYRAGERIGPNTGLMAPNAAKLSDDDIANVSNYIATLTE